MGFFNFLNSAEKNIGQAASSGFNFFKGVGTGLVNDVKNAGDVANAGIQGISGLAAIATAAATHNKQAEQNDIQKTQSAVNSSLKASRGLLTPQEAATGGTALIKPVARGVLTYAPFALGGAGGGIADAAGVEGTAARLGTQAAANFGINTGLNVGNQAVNGQPINIGQAAKSAIAPTAFSSALEVAPAALQHIANNPLGESGALPIGKLINAKSTTEVKAVLKDELPPAVVDKVAPAIAITKDPNIIQDIITKAQSPAPPSVTPDLTSTPVSDVTNPAGQGSLPVSVPSEVTATRPLDSPQQQIIDSLNGKGGAVSTRAKQEASYSAERSSRLGASQAAGADLPGSPGYQAELGSLKGELQKQKYTGISQDKSPAEQEALFTQLRQQVKDNPNVQGFDDINTQKALHKVIFGDAGVPTQSEIKLLQNAFGGEFADSVTNSIHSSLGDKAFALWRSGLLTGPQTITKIITSHTVNSALENAKDVPAAGIDKLLSLFTGQRSTTLTGRGLVQGAKQGGQQSLDYIKTGLEKDAQGNSIEFKNTVNFGNSVPGKIAQAYADGVGRIHGALYKPFYGAAHLQSLYQQGLAAFKNAGLDASEKESFLQKFVNNPDAASLNIAKHDAQVATFQQETQLGKIASSIQQKGGILGKVIAPFTKIPSAIATDLFNYSPVGGVKSIFDGVKAARSAEGLTLADQRLLSQGLGRSITGSAAIIPGIMLYNKGIMTLGYPTDPKEQKLWAEQGKIPNAVKIGGQWRSLGSIGPLGSVFSIGGHIADSLLQGKDIGTALTDGLVGGAQSIEEQSYLRGVSGAINAVNDPGRYAGNFLKQTAGSIVPTGVATIAAATDSNQRAADTPLDTIKSRIPGIIPGGRSSLPVKTDALGNPLKAPETGIEKIIDPFQSSTATKPTPLTTELNRLQNLGQGVQPATIAKNTSFDNVKTPLSPTQVRELTANIGKVTKDIWTQITQDPGYASLPDEQKQQILSSVYSAIASQEKAKFAQKYNFGVYSPTYQADRIKSLTGRQYAYQQ